MNRVNLFLMVFLLTTGRFATAVSPAVTNFNGCGIQHRCIRGNFPVYATAGDQMFQFQLVNHGVEPVVVRIQTVAKESFTYASFLDITMKSESTFVCSGSANNASDVGNLFNNQTCQTYTSFETIEPGEMKIHSLMSKITAFGAADTESTSKYKIEVFSQKGYVTGNLIVSQADGMVFAFIPYGAGVGTMRRTFTIPLNGGRPF